MKTAIIPIPKPTPKKTPTRELCLRNCNSTKGEVGKHGMVRECEHGRLWLWTRSIPPFGPNKIRLQAWKRLHPIKDWRGHLMAKRALHDAEARR